nr:MAG TPA: Terminase small subunit [Caudoviricetes sp.]
MAKKTAAKTKKRVEDKKALFLKAFTQSRGIIAPACRAVSMTRQLYYKWLEDDPSFAEAVEAIRQEQIDTVESALLNKIEDGDTTAVIFYLKTKGKERGYSERTELTGRDGKDLIPDIRIEIVDADYSGD